MTAHRAIGSMVTIKGEPDLAAQVVGVLLRECGVEYEIAWFANGERKTAWVWSSELISPPAQRGQCGFNPPAPPTSGQTAILQSIAAGIATMPSPPPPQNP